VLRGLGNGECIFRDLDGRAGRVGIDLISDELRRRLDTNPTRARREDTARPAAAAAHEARPAASPPAPPPGAPHPPAPQAADSPAPAG
jgi:hypothetical protein